MIVLGRILAPYGVKGWVKVRTFGDDPESWKRMSRWWLGQDPEGDQWRELWLDGFKAHAGGWVAKFTGLEDREGAESLGGLYVAAPREALPKTDADEYYWTDLIGLAVVTESGDALGRVESLIETGANQVLVVRDGDAAQSKRLLPFITQVIKAVDVPGGKITVAWQADW
jgi:16S rRNA processing protein RimM